MSRPIRIAIVGAGPSGLYAADALIGQDEIPVSVDVFDRLPVPFGLVRYGVAPDHFSIRSVRNTLEKILHKNHVRFLGNVEIGTDLTMGDLERFYDAVIWTYGAARDRALGIEGEGVAGSIAATDLVAWYCGHPDAARGEIESVVTSAKSVAVIGVGNVAVDVVRVLAKNSDELQETDIPQHVLDILGSSQITDIHLVGRRGPAQATFTTKELRELGELADADVIMDGAQLSLDPASEAAVADSKTVAKNIEVMREWSERTSEGKKRRIHMHFFARPDHLEGSDRVESLVVERTELDSDGGARGTGETYGIDVDTVVRAVGYRGVALDGVPFDARRNVIPNEAGRVELDGAVLPGQYVAGWIKRGPTGIIGTNKKDATETVASLLADAATLNRATAPDPSDVDAALADVDVVVLDGWSNIDAAERELGAKRGRERTTIHDRDDLLNAAKG